jgi:hypothetical protein
VQSGGDCIPYRLAGLTRSVDDPAEIRFVNANQLGEPVLTHSGLIDGQLQIGVNRTLIRGQCGLSPRAVCSLQPLCDVAKLQEATRSCHRALVIAESLRGGRGNLKRTIALPGDHRRLKRYPVFSFTPINSMTIVLFQVLTAKLASVPEVLRCVRICSHISALIFFGEGIFDQ